MKIKAAIFDMDGTLVDSLMLWDVIWAIFGKEYLGNESFTPSKEDDKTVRTLTLKDAMDLIHKNYSIGESGGELLEKTNCILLDFYKNDVKMKAGAKEFLEHLKAQGVKMCIATATAPDLVDIAIKSCGIGQYFSALISCATIGKGKEHPDVFLKACEVLGESISETWVFEDSLTAIKTATEIGMPTVGIYDRYNFGQEDIKAIATEYINDGETLLKLIKQA